MNKHPFITWFASNPVVANILMFSILGAGVFTALKVRKEGFPAFAAESVTIEVPIRGGTPENVERGVAIKIEESLVVRHRVHSRHEPLLDAERVVHHFHHRGEAVGCARSVRNEVVVLGEDGIVHAEHDRGIDLVLCRDSENHFLRTAGKVHGNLFTLTENSGRFDNYLNSEFLPGKFGGVFLGIDLQGFSVDNEIIPVRRNFSGKTTVS